jgi:hypothetical protein
MKLTYRLDYSDDTPDGDRGYEVLRRGYVIGYVEKDWVPNPIEGGDPVRSWSFTHVDGRRADGPSRPKAVEAALALPPRG